MDDLANFYHHGSLAEEVFRINSAESMYKSFSQIAKSVVLQNENEGPSSPAPAGATTGSGSGFHQPKQRPKVEAPPKDPQVKVEVCTFGDVDPDLDPREHDLYQFSHDDDLSNSNVHPPETETEAEANSIMGLECNWDQDETEEETNGYLGESFGNDGPRPRPEDDDYARDDGDQNPYRIIIKEEVLDQSFESLREQEDFNHLRVLETSMEELKGNICYLETRLRLALEHFQRAPPKTVQVELGGNEAQRSKQELIATMSDTYKINVLSKVNNVTRLLKSLSSLIGTVLPVRGPGRPKLKSKKLKPPVSNVGKTKAKGSNSIPGRKNSTIRDTMLKEAESFLTRGTSDAKQMKKYIHSDYEDPNELTNVRRSRRDKVNINYKALESKNDKLVNSAIAQLKGTKGGTGRPKSVKTKDSSSSSGSSGSSSDSSSSDSDSDNSTNSSDPQIKRPRIEQNEPKVKKRKDIGVATCESKILKKFIVESRLSNNSIHKVICKLCKTSLYYGSLYKLNDHYDQCEGKYLESRGKGKKVEYSKQLKKIKVEKVQAQDEATATMSEVSASTTESTFVVQS